MALENTQVILNNVWDSVNGLLKVGIRAGTALMGKVQVRNTTNTADINPLSEETFAAAIAAYLKIQGAAADGAAAVGNPVLSGGVDGSGNAQSLGLNTFGKVQLGGTVAIGDGFTGGPAGQFIGNNDGNATFATQGFGFNGTSYDRLRCTHKITLLASNARTATPIVADQGNINHRGAQIYVNVTAMDAGAQLTLKIKGKDDLSGVYFDILIGTAIVATGFYVFQIYPGITAVAGSIGNAILPRTWTVVPEHLDAKSITYSIGGSLEV